MNQPITKQQVLLMFCKDMEQPAIQMALYRSFRKYADLRDKLADQYASKTQIPADEFLSAYARYSFDKLT